MQPVYTPLVPRHNGVLAQLVERLNGIEEVSGSNPLCSIPQPSHLGGIQMRGLFLCLEITRPAHASARRERPHHAPEEAVFTPIDSPRPHRRLTPAGATAAQSSKVPYRSLCERPKRSRRHLSLPFSSDYSRPMPAACRARTNMKASADSIECQSEGLFASRIFAPPGASRAGVFRL